MSFADNRILVAEQHNFKPGDVTSGSVWKGLIDMPNRAKSRTVDGAPAPVIVTRPRRDFAPSDGDRHGGLLLVRPSIRLVRCD